MTTPPSFFGRARRCAAFLFALCAGAFAADGIVGAPRASVPPETLYVSFETDPDIKATLATLQGLLARAGSTEQIYFTRGDDAYLHWLGMLEANLGVKAVFGMSSDALLKKFAHAARGIVAYDPDDKDAFNGKAMRAALSNAVLVARANVARIAALTGWRECAEQAPAALGDPALQRATFAEQTPLFRERLRDYASMTQMPVYYGLKFFPNAGVAPRKDGGSPVFGWGDMANDGGEGDIISFYSRRGFFAVPSDHLENLSVLSAYDWPTPLKQRVPPAQAVENTKTRLVSFVLTDGDNLTWTSTNMAGDKEWFSSPARARIPMGFGLPPAAFALNAPSVAWYYAQANIAPSNRDAFVAGPSGLGYFYPSRFPAEMLPAHTARLAAAMEKMDLTYAQILDFNAFERDDLWREYLKHPQIGGLIYIEYEPYHGARGKVRWVEGKPVVGLRGSFWKGLKGGSAEALRDMVASMPADLTRADGYALICVHAWTHSLEDVEALIKSLPENVTVVAPDVFFETLKKYLKPNS